MLRLKRTSGAPVDQTPGGWDVAVQSRDVQGLEQLRATEDIVRDSWLREAGGALVLRVAAADVDAVARVLATQLPRRLYVVHSRYSATQLREVEDMFNEHHHDWGFESWSCQGLDAECQPYADVVLPESAPTWPLGRKTLPDGLLTLHPAMTPAG
jgi:hypothetical protein